MKSITLKCSLLNEIKYTDNKKDFPGNSFADIWIIDMQPMLEKIDFYSSLLNEKETGKIKKFYHEEDRKKQIISKAILKIILSKYTGIGHASIIIENNENGKPYILDQDQYIIHFNLSHSGYTSLLAVSSYPVGADVEKINIDFQFQEIAERCFSKEEKNYIEKSSNAADDFYLLWTRKEAIVKATSQGIDDRLCFINCLSGANKVSKKHVNSTHDWNIVSYCSGMFMFSIAYAKELLINFYNQLPVEALLS